MQLILVPGYKTAFAWLHEARNGKVSIADAEANLAFQFSCGNFSYSHFVVEHFNCVLGVSGTLDLSSKQLEMLKVSYVHIADCCKFLEIQKI
jgi:hypothetical protein